MIHEQISYLMDVHEEYLKLQSALVVKGLHAEAKEIEKKADAVLESLKFLIAKSKEGE